MSEGDWRGGRGAVYREPECRMDKKGYVASVVYKFNNMGEGLQESPPPYTPRTEGSSSFLDNLLKQNSWHKKITFILVILIFILALGTMYFLLTHHNSSIITTPSTTIKPSDVHTNPSTAKIETTKPKGPEYIYIRVNHYGAYVARFYISWVEVDERRGTEERKYWDMNGKGLTAGFSQAVPIKRGSKNLNVMAQGNNVFSWKTILDRQNVPIIPELEFKVEGTIFSPKSYVIKPNHLL